MADVKRIFEENTWAARARRTVTSVLPVDKGRKGRCRRCGACCKLPVECTFLAVDEDGLCSCKIWRLRPLNCRKYPRSCDEHLTREICGYYFEKTAKTAK
ncbi:MAG: hypothetical protein A2Y07_00665 [Planctomycetes bacterium GWF2_50_10]|nr:MAG: hypothetical protein A2Y07_00665 [Planctomycetes bacterium GWF2_50_10]